MDNYYFLFKPGRHIFAKFLKKDFGHCALIYEYLGLYILMETTGKHTEITPILCDINVFLRKLIKELGFKIVKIKVDKSKFNYKSIYNIFPSCVNFCKVVSSYRCRAQTPYGLYKHLLTNGGEEIGE